MCAHPQLSSSPATAGWMEPPRVPNPAAATALTSRARAVAWAARSHVAWRVAPAPCSRPPLAVAHSSRRRYAAQVKQTQAYCAGNFGEWDEKITTFPGLYALGAAAAWLAALGGGGGATSGCTLPVLRAVNLLPALATPPLLLALLRRLHPEARPSDLLGNALRLSTLHP